MVLRQQSALGHDDLEVFAGHDQRFLAASVHAAEQGSQIGGKGSLFAGIDRGKRALGWPVIGLEDLQPMLSRPVAEIEDPPVRLDLMT